MNRCGYWAHCAHHCDLPCDHDAWCPGFPRAGVGVGDAPRRGLLPSLLRRLATRLEN